MAQAGQTWAIVLAAGAGSRLQVLTTTSTGVAIPKQFCSLRGGESLLHEAIRRARRVCGRERICAVVAEEQRQWWMPVLSALPRENAIVQPRNRGTGNGILLPLLHILERDPSAQIVLLPSDHHVRDEPTLGHSLARALAMLAGRRSRAIFLGIEPDEADPALGYIVPDGSDGGALRRVAQFVEKPSAALARVLIGEGALWNAFIVAAGARELLALFDEQYPGIVAEMQRAVRHDAGDPGRPAAVAQLYQSLPEVDFSRHIAERAYGALSVLAVPPCGWSDLGTPARVARTLESLPPRTLRRSEAPLSAPRGQLNLAAQHARLTAA